MFDLNAGRDEEPGCRLQQERPAVARLLLAQETVAVIARGSGEIFTLQDQGGRLGLCWGLNYKHLNIFVAACVRPPQPHYLAQHNVL